MTGMPGLSTSPRLAAGQYWMIVLILGVVIVVLLWLIAGTL